MRWSARLTGSPWRVAPPKDDQVALPGPRDPLGHVDLPGPDQLLDLHDLYDLRDVLGRLPAPVVITYGARHRLGYANDAYRELFGTPPNGQPAEEALPELDGLGLLPLLDQVLRSGRGRGVKARSITDPADPTRTRCFNVSCVPLHSTERVSSRDGQPPAVGVLVFAAEVTDQVAAATRLREAERRQREAAVTLQRSLLPQKLEQPADLRVAATYQPGGADAAVGGDWYDVISLRGGRTALVIGDVMGRGLRAAAVMGQLRTAVRAYARLDLPPHQVMTLLDGIAMEIDANQIATCIYAVYDAPSASGKAGTLTYSSAGHLPLMLRGPDGTVLQGEQVNGPPLGTGGGNHVSHTLRLFPGTTGVLYTDGLVERRDQDIDQGLGVLARTLAGAVGSPDVVCSRLLRAMGVTAEHDDDVAVLAFQLPGTEPAVPAQGRLTSAVDSELGEV
ncbi:PP2C family protein-serine/threonine phosphatase [Kitasatospora viridis]|uniref:Serine phosphatase RsbU (Regulator of sigma subunit) n=1 Tax=Kitasatospora viridis TaxID=281105 RepID=A0A561UGM9_9ACTN|nr:serine phosphatase RsbU (regulator of sigma subunit) [Kitasatospora viridis]